MKKLLCLLFISLIIISGCFEKAPVSSPKGSITLVVSSSGLSARTIKPDLDMTIATYDIYGIGPDGTNFRKNGQSGNTVLLDALAAGTWTITADAKNDEGIIIASGFTTVTVVAGITTNADVTVTPLTGTGALKVNLSWPGGVITNPVINATLTPKGGAASTISFTLSGDTLSALYENTALAAGYYTLLVYLYDGTVFKWGAAEAVRIIKDQTSEGNYPIIPGGGDIGDINLIITPDLQNPIGITFSGATDNLAIGTNMTITATTTEEVETYQWYLNGKPLSGETTNTITIGSALPKGNYRLDLLVGKNSIISSGTVSFMVTGGGGVVAIAAGYNHSLALKADGTVWAWGYGGFGQLGDGFNMNRNHPVQVLDLSDVKAIYCGGYNSFALKNDGSLWGWGYNAFGLLGDGTEEHRNRPVRVMGLTGVITFTAGASHSMALKSDGTVWAWGSNTRGQLGDGTDVDHDLPAQITGLPQITAIDCGVEHNYALAADKTIWAWGYNNYGQSGNEYSYYRNYPAQISGLAGVSTLFGGGYHGFAINNNGIWAWGLNYLGELGNGTNNNTYSPVQVLGLNNVICIASIYNHNIALKEDGTVWSWGCNDYGQLGDGSLINRNLPAQITGLTGVSDVAAGGWHSLAIKDGTIYAWGGNADGQLGDGTNTGRNFPVPVNEF